MQSRIPVVWEPGHVPDIADDGSGDDRVGTVQAGTLFQQVARLVRLR
jgi:hypothetical protein